MVTKEGLSNFFANLLSDDKVKVMKGVLAGFLILAIMGFAPVFEHLTTLMTLHPIVIGYISQLYYALVIVLVMFVIFFLGKPIFTPAEIIEEVDEEIKVIDEKIEE